MSVEINLAALTELQEFGDEGRFAILMAAYIKSLAGRLEQARADLARYAAEVRNRLGKIPGAHERHPDAIAQLVAGYRLFMKWASEKGLASYPDADHLVSIATASLSELGHAQADPQRESKLGRRFLDLIASSLWSKRYHLADANSDNAPDAYAGACGWHKDWLYQGSDTGQTLDWKIPPNSKLLGFIDEAAGMVYLSPTEAIAVATEMSRRHNTLQSFESIGRELLNEGLCQSHVEAGKVRASRNQRIAKQANTRYFWIPIKHLFGDP